MRRDRKNSLDKSKRKKEIREKNRRQNERKSEE